MTSEVLAPELVKKMHKACGKYDKWKGKHNPNNRPWIFPEQITLPRLDPKDINAFDLAQINKNVSAESQINENEIDKSDLNDNDDKD